MSKYSNDSIYDFIKILLTHGLFQTCVQVSYTLTNHMKTVAEPEIGAGREVGCGTAVGCGVREEARHPLYG